MLDPPAAPSPEPVHLAVGEFGVQARPDIRCADAAEVHAQRLFQSLVIVGGEAEVGLKAGVDTGVAVVIDGTRSASWQAKVVRTRCLEVMGRPFQPQMDTDELEWG